ncbi:MAG: hypothetical protein AUH85_12050 [Chloroflexi bacterium 13_1_40CM_4_68_4]|nr:MAG: hypothetical protein AUH85_12050 [Chloroflexi bacterium 13_1_40CM_4_68_4]
MIRECVPSIVLAPGHMLAGSGLGTPAEGVVLSQDVGATLLGAALINRLAHDATGFGAPPDPRRQHLRPGRRDPGEGLRDRDLPAEAALGLLIPIVLGAIIVPALLRPEPVRTAIRAQ